MTTTPLESDRRRTDARGVAVLLADGRPWLLAEPTFRAGRGALTTPDVDSIVDRLHERIVLGDDVPLDEVFFAARALLRANYDLSDAEVDLLLDVAAGDEAQELARGVFEALFGPEHRVRGYTDWVRASLLANGLDRAEIPSSAVGDVLAVLVAGRRAVPAGQFVDACRAARDREAREALV